MHQKKEEKISQAPSIISVIHREDISKFGGKNLLEILERVTSIYTLSSYLFVQNKVSMRGDWLSHTDDHVLLLLNGRPMRETFAGGWNYAVYGAFPIQMIDKIEIIRGPGSVLYGTNAFVGVINIITKKSTEGFKGEFSAGGGSFNGKLCSAAFGSGDENSNFYVGLKYFDEDGWNYGHVDERGVYKQHDMVEKHLGLVAIYNKNHFNATFNVFSSEQYRTGTAPIWAFEGYNEMLRMFGDIGYNIEFSEMWNLTTNLTANYSKHEFLDGDLGGSDPQPEQGPGWDIIGEISLFGQLTEQIDFILGGSVNKRKSEEEGDLISAPGLPWDGLRTQYTQVYNQTNYSLYSQMSYAPVESMKFVAGAQWNKPDGIGGDIVPRIAFINNFNANWGAKLLYGQAFRSPWPIETNMHHFVLHGNPELEPVKITTIEAQLFYSISIFNVALTVFSNKYKDLISRTAGTIAQFTYTNQGEMDVKGLEFEGKKYFGANMYIMGSWMHQENEKEGVDNYTQIPNDLIKIGISYNIMDNALQIGLFNTYVTEPTSNTEIKPGTNVVNPEPASFNWMTLNISYNFSRYLADDLSTEYSINLYVENLLDEEVYYPESARRNINSFPGRSGRAIYGKLTLRV